MANIWLVRNFLLETTAAVSKPMPFSISEYSSIYLLADQIC